MLREQIDNFRRRIEAALAPLTARTRERIAPLYAEVRSRYEKLEPRERWLVQIAGGLLAAYMAYGLIISPIAGLIGGLDGRIAEREHDLANVRRLASVYKQVKSELSEAEHNTVPKAKDFSLFSVVEASFTKSVGREKIASITPAADRKLTGGLVQYSVQLKLTDVSLAQIVDALYAMRTLKLPVGVSNLRIQRRAQNLHSYDVDITCVALGNSA
jgi:type II secretory pathway component PulM